MWVISIYVIISHVYPCTSPIYPHTISQGSCRSRAAGGAGGAPDSLGALCEDVTEGIAWGIERPIPVTD